MEITLEEAFAGKTAQMRLPTSVTCEACSGSGAKAGTKPKTCPPCGGHGRVRHAQGFFTLERTCPTCQGRGQVIDDPCPSCAGSGRVTRERTLSVNIPPGVEDGTRIRLAGEGEAGVRGGPPGDLYIFLSLGAHAFFQRDGADLHCRVPISMVTAALGGEFEVPTIDGGKARVKVPDGTQSGRRFRLQGKGMPVLRSKQTGDMYVQVVVETPQNLTKRQRELLDEFEKLSSKETQPEASGLLRPGQGVLRQRRAGSGLIGSTRLDPRPAAPLPIDGSQCSQCVESRCPHAIARPSDARKEDRKANSSASSRKSGLRFDDEVRFIRSWIEKPLSIGAVTPSGKVLARTMARYVDPDVAGPGHRAWPRHRPGDRGAGRARHRSVAAGAGRIQSDLLPAAAHALSGRDRGAGRRLPPPAPARRPAARAGGRGGVRACRC